MEILQYAFMKRAILAGTMAGLSCGLAGVLVVSLRISAIGICLAHAAFAGALLGVLLGGDPLPWAFAFSLGTAALIGPLADRSRFTPETSVGIVFSAMLAFAFLFIGLMPGSRASALNLFWGSILTITEQDLVVLLGVSAAQLLFLFLFFKEIQAVLCHRSVALAVGIPATAVYYGMLFFTGATVTASLKSIGGLLIYSLVVNPAAAAYQTTYSLGELFLLSALLGIAACWGGLAVSHAFDLPSGAAIALCSTAVFCAVSAFSPKRRGLARFRVAHSEEGRKRAAR